MRGDDRSEDAPCSDEMRQIHEEDGDRAPPLLRDQSLVLGPSCALVELADREGRACGPNYAVEGADDEAGHDQLKLDVVGVLYLSKDQQDYEDYLRQVVNIVIYSDIGVILKFGKRAAFQV